MRTYTFILLTALPLITAQRAVAQNAQDLRRLSLEELLSIEVTTVSRMPQPTALAPAAVYVITQQDIRRSGVTSIVEALQLVPGVQVARIDANKWAVGIRGFADRLARSMLVMIDGRAVYSPLFAGTYWEVQDTMMDDIDRIEVIRGPGGTLWGANAVNGIINIITKSAQATQGRLLELGGGSEEYGSFAFRYGGAHGQNIHYRAYGKLLSRGPAFHADGNDYDDFRTAQAGFRSDWSLARERALTIQGDAYRTTAGQRVMLTSYTVPYSQFVNDDADLSGGNVVGRLSGPLGGLAGFKLQAYYDRTHRREATFEEARDTFDVDFQSTIPPFKRHALALGAGYRVSSGETTSTDTIHFLPPSRTDQLLSGFVQDEIDVVTNRVRVSVGVKFEHNDYSGFEVQPSGRVLWTVSPANTFIVSVTHAVRTPSRVETDLELTNLVDPGVPGFIRLLPNDAFQPERLIAYELGYRVRPADRLFVTLSTFLNQHDAVLDARAFTPFVESAPGTPHLVVPVRLVNGLHGNSHGFELTSDLRLTDWWRWTTAYSFLRIQLTPDASGGDLSQERSLEDSSPRHTFVMQSTFDLPRGVDLDWVFRHVSELRDDGVPAYSASNLRLGWLATRNVELAVIGKNLHEAHHLEFPGGAIGNVEIQRSATAQLTWRW